MKKKCIFNLNHATKFHYGQEGVSKHLVLLVNISHLSNLTLSSDNLLVRREGKNN